uniref:Uncharacterized protein n=1 Tax=Caenorhabditis japonica TaxID=281687 RepID=A0A8R1E910_CAEJA
MDESENNFHPTVIELINEEPMIRRGGGMDHRYVSTESSCFCMPIKFWIIGLSIFHTVLLILTAMSIGLIFLLEIFLIVFALLVVFVPDVFAVLVNYFIQLVFWTLVSIYGIITLLSNSFRREEILNVLVLTCLSASSVCFAVIFIRLAVASASQR